MLDALSKELHASYMATQLISHASMLPCLTAEGARDLYSDMSGRFETLWGLFFNQVINVKKNHSSLEKFAATARRLMAEGVIGPNPTNLPIQAKISKERAKELEDEGHVVPAWYVRTDDEEFKLNELRKQWAAQDPEHGGMFAGWKVASK